ncbi:protein phosphatase 2C domain-containing protein [Micromonospora sp. NBC_01740]|uniref:protein phosphatase 2C domain-containing protein n=1 Tax=Micromonospora sp. NBC_01740 TaxID=2975986 RepID=UPI002E100D44|nr:protein phosphatase 2C domain-containing protein [Micromonospora sp. NBC_01740]
MIVLDGASQPDPTERDGGWLADTLGRTVRDNLAQRTDSLAAILADSIDAVSRRYGLKPGSSPSTTVSIVRWDADSVDVLVLGDSPVVALTTDGNVHEVRDDRLQDSARHQRERLRSGTAEQHHELWRSLVAAERSRRNQPGGYWIAEADPTAAWNAYAYRWHRQELRAILAVTDGVSAGIDRYGIPPDWPSAFYLALENPQTLVDAVHEAEERDRECRQWPRSKRHDDKAAAIIGFGCEEEGRRGDGGGA